MPNTMAEETKNTENAQSRDQTANLPKQTDQKSETVKNAEISEDFSKGIHFLGGAIRKQGIETFHFFVDQLKTFGKTILGKGKDMLGNIKDKGGKKLESMMGMAKEIGQDIKEQTKTVQKNSTEKVNNAINGNAQKSEGDMQDTSKTNVPTPEKKGGLPV